MFKPSQKKISPPTYQNRGAWTINADDNIWLIGLSFEFRSAFENFSDKKSSLNIMKIKYV